MVDFACLMMRESYSSGEDGGIVTRSAWDATGQADNPYGPQGGWVGGRTVLLDLHCEASLRILSKARAAQLFTPIHPAPV